MERKSKKPSVARSPLAIGAAIGTVVGLLFLAISLATAFGICSDTSAAETFFPYSMMIGPSLDAAGPMLLIALIQYPLYGALIGGFCSLKGWRKYPVIPILFLVAEIHYFAV